MNTRVLPIRPNLTMSKMGTLKVKEKPIKDSEFGIRTLENYAGIYYAHNTFRKESEKAGRYFNGDQWHELVTDSNGNTMTEYDYIISQGKTPLQQNMIKSTIRTLEGQFRTDTSMSIVVASTPEKAKESEMLSNALQCSLSTINYAKDLDARTLESFLISGLAVQRVSWKYVPELNRKEVVIEDINRNSIFFNGDILDIRGNDIRVIGRLIDSTMEEMIEQYGTTPERVEQLKEIYRTTNNEFYTSLEANDPTFLYNKDFYVPTNIQMCRVIEVWEKKLVKRMLVHDWMNGNEFYADWTYSQLNQANELRKQQYAKVRTPEFPMGVPADQVPIMEGELEYVQRWSYAYYSPYGHILREGETPFSHGSHPFIVLAYPLLDGKITGLASDLIDAQRQINRLLILQDMILSSSVKNTLIVDEESMDGKTKEQIGEDYKQIGGVIVAKLAAGKRIGDIAMELKGSVGNLGIAEMIQLYVRMLQDVSGVHPAMQGQQAQSGTSGRLYDAQIMQSNLNSKDIMDTFTGLFRRNRDMKVLHTIQQYYTTKRMLAVSGKSYSDTAQLYDPEKAQPIEFDLVIGQTADSPVYRAVIEDTLKEFVMKGLIDLKTFLSNTTMPYGAKMLEDIKKAEEQAQINPRQAVAGLAQSVQNANIGADPRVVDMAQRGLKQAS